MPVADFEYDETVSLVKNVLFGILSPERILQKSACQIYKHITSLKDPEGTLMDPRLGPIDRGVICKTCSQNYKSCPGHFGHLCLAKPVIQVQYYTMIIKLLSYFCGRCSSLLINKYNESIMTELKSKKGKGRFAYIEKLRKPVKECPNCGATQPKYSKKKDGMLIIVAKYVDKKQGDITTMIMNPEMIHTIFKHITDEDVELIGLDPKLSRPEWMIWTIMPIPPPAMRPSVKRDSGGSQDDDLTLILNSVIKFNNQLRLKMTENVGQNMINGYWQLLQYYTATYVDNELANVSKASQRSGRPLKTIRQRVKAKEGRVRGNLMGKRVDGSARSVITADPYLQLDQLGVPERVAMNLTYPEIVTLYNIEKMTQLVRNGPDIYPGAKGFKIKGEKNRKSLKQYKNREEIVLKPGDIVYRHLIDNDVVLFNRQPSLHKMSMMAHRVKVVKSLTFRIHVNVCAPYNADYDGKMQISKKSLPSASGCLIGC